MSINFALIGGDMRIIELAKILAKDGNMVYTYGLGNESVLENITNITCCGTMLQATKNAEFIIGPTPFSSNSTDINAPFSEEKISIKELLSNIQGKVLIAGSVKKEIYDLVENKSNLIDIMEREELTILNVIATAEGAIEVAMSNTNRILHGSNVLILGFGRIGKILAKKMEGLSCKITCSARKNEDFAWIKAYGYNCINTNHLGENLSKFDIIINTIPHLILDKERLNHVSKDSLLIDLASKPGGIDEEYAKQIGIKVVWALALPGKVAPVTSAEFIKDTIYNIIARV